LNFSRLSHYVEGIVGKDFLERHFAGNFKGLVPLILFTGGLVLPLLIEELSFRRSYKLYRATVGPLEKVYIMEFEMAGGIVDDLVETGYILKPVRIAELKVLYKKIITFQEPHSGIIVEVLRKYNL